MYEAMGDAIENFVKLSLILIACMFPFTCVGIYISMVWVAQFISLHWR